MIDELSPQCLQQRSTPSSVASTGAGAGAGASADAAAAAAPPPQVGQPPSPPSGDGQGSMRVFVRSMLATQIMHFKDMVATGESPSVRAALITHVTELGPAVAGMKRAGHAVSLGRQHPCLVSVCGEQLAHCRWRLRQCWAGAHHGCHQACPRRLGGPVCDAAAAAARCELSHDGTFESGRGPAECCAFIRQFAVSCSRRICSCCCGHQRVRCGRQRTRCGGSAPTAGGIR